MSRRASTVQQGPSLSTAEGSGSSRVTPNRDRHPNPLGRGLVLILVAVLLAGATYVVRAVSGSDVRPRPPTTRAGGLEAPGGPAGLSQAPGRPQIQEIERLIRAFGGRVREQPNALDFTFLGRLQLMRGRLTGDVAAYGQARSDLTRALDLYPDDPEAAALLAVVRYTTHDFHGALDLASGVYDQDPSRYGALAVIGDAQMELGRYDEAEATYAQLARGVPEAGAVQARRSRMAFLRGDGEQAMGLAQIAEKQARDAGAFGAELSFYSVLQGQVAFDAGNYDEAAAHFEEALRVAPDYYVARAMLAKARAAQGRTDNAIRLYVRAIALVPQPDFLAALGDLYAIRGERRLAEEQYATVEAIATLARVNKQVYNRQLALFYADHDVDVERAVELTESELRVREDVYGYDAYGWALYKAGRLEEARAASEQALRLGTSDPKLWYHAGMISAALGADDLAREQLGRSLSLGPAFDPLQAPIARRMLQDLGSPT
jgi:tetratricopeptide (TPR) repeat protein